MKKAIAIAVTVSLWQLDTWLLKNEKRLKHRRYIGDTILFRPLFFSFNTLVLSGVPHLIPDRISGLLEIKADFRTGVLEAE